MPRIPVRLRIEQVTPDDTGRIPGDPRHHPAPMWMDGDNVRLTLTTASGATILDVGMEELALRGQLAPDGEILRYHYEPTRYPEDD